MSAPQSSGALSALAPFELERYFAQHEFSAEHLLCVSDVESLTMSEVLEMADDDCRERWQNLTLAYTESRGLPALREEIASLYTSLSPEDVFTCAPEEGIMLSMLALLRAGDHVVVAVPGYQSLFEIATSLGCEVTPWTPRVTAGGALAFDVADLPSLLRPTTRLVVVNFPHNPTGAALSKADWATLLATVQGHESGCYLFSDEMYRWLVTDPDADCPSAADAPLVAAAPASSQSQLPSPSRQTPPGAAPNSASRVGRPADSPGVISLGGVSKTFGAPGLRVGWLASKDKAFMARVAELKDYTTICMSAPSEVLALIILRNRERIVKRSKQIVADNLAVLDAFFAGPAGAAYFRWETPRGSSVAFPLIATGEPAESFCERVLEVTGILLLPGTKFLLGTQDCSKRVRFGFGRRNLPEVMALLENFLLKELREKKLRQAEEEEAERAKQQERVQRQGQPGEGGWLSGSGSRWGCW